MTDVSEVAAKLRQGEAATWAEAMALVEEVERLKSALKELEARLQQMESFNICTRSELDDAVKAERLEVLLLAEEFGQVEGAATEFPSFVEVLRGRTRTEGT